MRAPRRLHSPTSSTVIGFLLPLALTLGGAAARAGGPPVVELFTSQSCYSCPPAEAFLGELAEREDLVALEFHVDYWNDLVYGSAGRWEDRFSDPAFTERQRRYAARIPGSQVYTPQVVIDGAAQTVGSRRGQVLRLIERAGAAAKPVRVTVRPEPAGGFTIELAPGAGGPPEDAAAVLLARYDLEQVTVVEAGENQGKTLTNHHVVRELRRLGEWSGGERTKVLAADVRLGPNQGCAVLVQAAGQGVVLGAATCPPSS